MQYEPLTQDPKSIDWKDATSEASSRMEILINELNQLMKNTSHDKLWYQPDNSNWPHRYFWVYHYNSEKRDFIVRIEFFTRHTIFVSFSHFGAKKPKEVDFMPIELFESLEYKGSPPHVEIKTDKDLHKYIPLIAEHFFRIFDHLENGGILPLHGCSHIELALGAFLDRNDNAEWLRWNRPEFLGRREVDLCCPDEKIAIEIQGDYWHKRKGQKEKDEQKKAELLENGWSLIWAWEGAIRGKFHLVINALEQIRSGEKFVEIRK